jgi:hypothetical protein
MKRFSVFYLIVMILLAETSFANIYKCVSDNGVVTFSDEPCSKEAEVFINTPPVLSIDEGISLASPFTQLIIESNTINEDLVTHAKKIGKCILPEEHYKSYILRGGNRRARRYPQWDISLKYGPPGNKSKWKITIEYRVKIKDDIPRIWLKTIYVFLWGRYYDPPSLSNAKKINRIRTGKWQVKWM